MKRLALNVWFYTAFVLGSIALIAVFTLVVVLVGLVAPRRRTMRLFRICMAIYGRYVTHVCMFPFVRVEFTDLEPRDMRAAAVYVCNHRAASDPFLVSCLHMEGVQVVNTWPMHLPVLGCFARWGGYLSVNEMPVEEFYARGLALLRQGVSIVAFPEGTRSGGRAMGPFRGAVLRLAQQARVPVVPMCIAGNERVPPKGSWWLEPAHIRIHKLPALPPEEVVALGAFQLKRRVWTAIAGHLDRMEGGA